MWKIVIALGLLTAAPAEARHAKPAAYRVYEQACDRAGHCVWTWRTFRNPIWR
jgi:hypothetical protein